MIRDLKKYTATIAVSISEVMAYKLDFLMQVLLPGIIFFFIKISLWRSIFEAKSGESLAGYSLSRMIEYQGWALIVFLLALSFNSRHLAEDIRLGRISSYLIYPFNFFQFHLSKFFGRQCIQGVVAAVTFLFLLSMGVMNLSIGTNFFMGVTVALLASFFWFLVQYALGLFAFWLEETWTLRVTFLIICNFFAGAIIPLEFFPEWARTLAMYSPFPLMTYIPVQFFMGSAPITFTHAVGLLGFWMLVALLLCALVWRQGIRLYSAAGM